MKCEHVVRLKYSFKTSCITVIWWKGDKWGLKQMLDSNILVNEGDRCLSIKSMQQ